ncbi:ArsR/SmtB family transcription factor [Paenibacillus massiliensis]|uniref:ArsR/SmtB family transcription factor n=1 Tax=Paenibacillus massiliensis TaxID=225917 RepID=UPI00037DD6B9|nr:winged helix-turn-helix domain-containing protein [Paenibacillus massiliensis]
MNAYPNIAVVASLIADPSRAIFLESLLDGRALPAGELAYMASVSPQTASSHLAKLVEGGLLTVEPQGRHRYYRIAGPEVARLVETMAHLAPPVQIRSLRQSEQLKRLSGARTCYRHLAGQLGIAICEALLAKGVLKEPAAVEERNYEITAEGYTWLKSFGIEWTGSSSSRRAIARQCLDWSERRYHVAGVLGEKLLNRLLDLGWIRTRPDSRAVDITLEGRAGLQESFGITWEAN